jgi:uncharacterized protein YkwD
MVRSHTFSHTGSDGSRVVDRAQKAGYVKRNSRWAIGEAIGWRWYGEGSPVRLIPEVLQSPAHYSQLMGDRYVDIGVGYLPSPPDATGKRGATLTVVVGHMQRLTR